MIAGRRAILWGISVSIIVVFLIFGHLCWYYFSSSYVLEDLKGKCLWCGVMVIGEGELRGSQGQYLIETYMGDIIVREAFDLNVCHNSTVSFEGRIVSKPWESALYLEDVQIITRRTGEYVNCYAHPDLEEVEY